MREKFINLARSCWRYANSNIGSAMVGAATAYVLTKGSGEEELKITKQRLEKSDENLIALEKKLRQSDEKMFDLLQSKIRDSSELQNCLRRKELVRYAYENSFCFFRHRYSEECEYGAERGQVNIGTVTAASEEVTTHAKR